MTFQSSSQAATCPSVYHTRWRLHTVPLIAERQAGKLWIPIFIVFGLTRPGIEPVSTASVADALSTRPLIGFCNFCNLKVLQCHRRQTKRFFRNFLAIFCAFVVSNGTCQVWCKSRHKWPNYGQKTIWLNNINLSQESLT